MKSLKNYLPSSNFTDILKSVRLFGLLLAIQFSTCAEPRLVRVYTYDGTPVEAAVQCRTVLEELNYKIEIYDPVGGIIVTEPFKYRADLRQFNYRVAVQIQDVVEIYLVVRKAVFNRSSDWSIGGKELIDEQVSDSMPYRIQKRIFSEITEKLHRRGFDSFDRKSRIGIANQ